MVQGKKLEVEVAISEDEIHTEATARVRIGDQQHEGSGVAKRNPADPNVPMIGEELATARALSDLSHRLVDAAAQTLEEHLGKPVTITE
ncbi:MAG: DUF1876 domain-containing protein [Actinomycetota bacterium]